MTKFFRNLLKLSQVIATVIIPIVVILYLFPDTFLSFLNPIKDFSKLLASIMMLFYKGEMDLTIVFLTLPWILYIIIAEIIINIINNVDKKTVEVVENIRTVNIEKVVVKRKEELKQILKEKQYSYCIIELIYSKFTISNLTEAEASKKKIDIKRRLLKDLSVYGGTCLDNSSFSREDIIPLLFFSQEDALNFLFKFLNILSVIDDDIQNFGYSLNYKILFDLQENDVNQKDNFAFADKALNALELDEVCATNDFSDRYTYFGIMKHILFESKGTYSINKKRVELIKINY